MSTVEIRLIGTKDECMTVVALLSHVAAIEVKTIRPADRATPGPTRQRVYAEIHTGLRDP